MKRIALRALPLTNMVRHRAKLSQTLGQAAVSVDEVHPCERETLPEVLCLDGEIDKATDSGSGDDFAEALRRAKTRDIHHAPVLRYNLKDCITGPEGVEYRGGAYKVTDRRRSIITPPLDEVTQACFPMTITSRSYFGHYLHDACAASLLAHPPEMLLLEHRPEWPDTVAYTQAFGLAPARIKPRFVRRLSVVSDHGLGPHKAARLKRLRQSVYDSFGTPQARSDRIYLKRPGAGAARAIADEQRLMDQLSVQGFRIVDPDGLSLAQLAEQLRAADLVVTMEGSHATHAYFLAPPGVGLLTLVPENRFCVIHRFLSHAFDARFGLCVCPQSREGYRVDVDTVLKTAELFERSDLTGP